MMPQSDRGQHPVIALYLPSQSFRSEIREWGAVPSINLGRETGSLSVMILDRVRHSAIWVAVDATNGDTNQSAESRQSLDCSASSPTEFQIDDCCNSRNGLTLNNTPAILDIPVLMITVSRYNYR